MKKPSLTDLNQYLRESIIGGLTDFVRIVTLQPVIKFLKEELSYKVVRPHRIYRQLRAENQNKIMFTKPAKPAKPSRLVYRSDPPLAVKENPNLLMDLREFLDSSLDSGKLDTERANEYIYRIDLTSSKDPLYSPEFVSLVREATGQEPTGSLAWNRLRDYIRNYVKP